MVLSKEGREKISESSKEQWKNGKKNPMLGKHHSEKTKKKMSELQSGEKNPRWNGGKRKVKAKREGEYYIYLLSPEHPSVAGKKKKYVAEHRLIMEEHLGRFLKEDEEVHHKNGVKNDNRIDNLEIVAHSNHAGKVCCPYCLKEFRIK